jgi:hypothetical protein
VGLFDDVSSLFSTAVGDIFGPPAPDSGPELGGSGSGGYPSFPMTQPRPVYQHVGSAMPVIAGVARWAMSFPNLWQAIQQIRANYRIPMTVDKLWSLAKSAGPQVLVGIIGAAALQELFVYHSTHKRRRMNVANTKALRRSVRRLKGFDRLSHRVSAQLSRVGGRSRRRSSSRCGTCRKNPCAC